MWKELIVLHNPGESPAVRISYEIKDEKINHTFAIGWMDGDVFRFMRFIPVTKIQAYLDLLYKAGYGV